MGALDPAVVNGAAAARRAWGARAGAFAVALTFLGGCRSTVAAPVDPPSPPSVSRRPLDAPAFGDLSALSAAAAAEEPPSPHVCAPAAQLEPLPLPELEAGGLSPENLMRWIAQLASAELRGREAGTRDARGAARFIADAFAALGAEPPGPHGYCLEFSADGLNDQNVVAHLAPLRGATRRWLVLAAHYDALGIDDAGRVRPGADDNASGVAVLLEAARLLAAARLSETGIVLAALGAEEKGTLGARAYVARPSVPLDRVELMVNVDMAGRRPANTSAIGFEAFGPERRETTRRVRGASARAGFPAIPARLGDRGDHVAFSATVPSVFFSTMVHRDYHSPNDTPERIVESQVAGACRLVLELVLGFDGPSRTSRSPDSVP